MLCSRVGATVEVILHADNEDLILAHLGYTSGHPYRIMIFSRSGDIDFFVHHLGPCPTFTTGPNASVFLESEPFHAIELLEPTEPIPKALYSRLSALRVLGVDPREL